MRIPNSQNEDELKTTVVSLNYKYRRCSGASHLGEQENRVLTGRKGQGTNTWVFMSKLQPSTDVLNTNNNNNNKTLWTGTSKDKEDFPSIWVLDGETATP